MRVFITLACAQCKSRNYHSNKHKKKTERLELRRFCRSCRKHTMHKEVK